MQKSTDLYRKEKRNIATYFPYAITREEILHPPTNEHLCKFQRLLEEMFQRYLLIIVVKYNI